MSFFDEADEPPRTVRSSTRPATRRGRSGTGGTGRGGGRRPPAGGQQSIRTRRAIAVIALVIVVVLIAVGINSCEGSAHKSALQNYADDVATIITNSNSTSHNLFAALAAAGSTSSSATAEKIVTAEGSAQDQLNSARRLSVPSSARSANTALVYALRMRLDGLTGIANEISSALNSSADQQTAVSDMTGQMARFYASDVLYKNYTLPALAAALHRDDITVGGDTGTQLNPGQFLPSISWLSPSYVGDELGVSVSSGKSGSSSSSSTPVTGLHGDGLLKVTVNGTTLADGTALSASPPPTFVLSVQDQGNYTENNVGCKVVVEGSSSEGSSVIPTIAKGQTATCSVTLRTAPPAGNFNVKATVAAVPGEHDLSNNSLAYAVAFK